METETPLLTSKLEIKSTPVNVGRKYNLWETQQIFHPVLVNGATKRFKPPVRAKTPHWGTQIQQTPGKPQKGGANLCVKTPGTKKGQRAQPPRFNKTPKPNLRKKDQKLTRLKRFSLGKNPGGPPERIGPQNQINPEIWFQRGKI